jgi:hypothetical protein
MLGSVLGGIAGLLTGGTAMAAAVGAGLGRLAVVEILKTH